MNQQWTRHNDNTRSNQQRAASIAEVSVHRDRHSHPEVFQLHLASPNLLLSLVGHPAAERGHLTVRNNNARCSAQLKQREKSFATDSKR